MGVAYRCDHGLGCTFVVFEGALTPESRADAERTLLADAAFPPGPAVLLDIAAVTDTFTFTPAVVSEIAAGWRALAAELGPIKIAMVTSALWKQAHQFSLEVEGSGVRVIVFTNGDSAASWLGLDPASARSILQELSTEAES